MSHCDCHEDYHELGAHSPECQPTEPSLSSPVITPVAKG